MPAKTNTEDDAENPEAGDTDAALAWGTTAFVPGADVALVARHTVGLIERDNPSTRERLWALVADDAPLDDILDELSSTGLKALPDFGLAQVEGSAVRLVARGRVEISAELGSGSSRDIDASGVRTWIEELVHDVAALTISLPAHDDDADAPSGEAFAVLAGSVPASSLTRRYDAPDDHATLAESGAGWTVGAASSDSASSESESDGQLAPTPEVELEMVADIDEPASASDAEPDADSDSAAAADPGAAASDSWFDEQADAAAVIPPQPQVDDDADGSAERGSDEPVDITADPEPADAPPADAPPADPQPASPQPPPPNAGPSGPPPSGPGAGGPPPSAGRPDPTVVVGSADGPARGPASSIFDDDFDDHAAGSATGAPIGDHDGMTSGRDDLDGDAGPSSDAPIYGVLAFSNGVRIDVDRAVLIGRNPKVAGAVDGGLPHIMKFDGPGQGLSRTHAEVRVVAGEVIVEDLQSTNGTEVQLPGQQRRRLRSGEPVAIVPGTLIDFGDELHCTLESVS